MSVLVIGANGLVGSALVRTCLDRGIEVSGTYHTKQPDFDVELFELDIRNSGRVREIVGDGDPDAVVNCAAYTDVDGCEQHPELAQAVNADAAGDLAAVCSDLGIEFVHLSTDYVFDGGADEPYTEADDPNPIQVYGETKLDGERQVLEATSEAIICRLSFVWGCHGATGDLEGFPAWVLGRARDGESVPLFTDQWVTPTNAGKAAEVVLELLDGDSTRVHHVASQDCVTAYAFGRMVLAEVDVDTVDFVEERSLSDVDRVAARPAYTCLSVTRGSQATTEERPALSAEISSALDSE